MKKHITLYATLFMLAVVFGCSQNFDRKNPVDPQVPPKTPVLSSPTNNATGISINPVLTWNAADGATSYTLQVSASAACTNFVYNQSGIVATSDTVTGLLYSTVYYWRVKADKKDISSAWAGIWQFTTTSATAPTVVTGSATSVTETSAQLNGTVNPNGQSTTYYFQYGLTTSYGTNTATQNAGTGTSALAVNANISGLTAGTIYHYRIAATNIGGTSYGNDDKFSPPLPIEWISIPAGNFTMGSTTSDPYYNTDELPQHTVYLDAYQISKYEVTNAQYKAFMDAGGYSISAYWATDGWNWRTTNSITQPYWWSTGEYNSGTAFPNHPVVGVSWYEAYAFCNWAGGHLPTEAQWEKAARGTDSSNYWPWGSTWDAGKCNSYYNTAPDTFAYSSPVDFFTTGISPYGVYDMAGNVWEWVNDWYQSDYYSVSTSSNPAGPTTGTSRVIRGGSFIGNDNNCRVSYRASGGPDGRNSSLGFRLAK
jgi:formylglycine-generating enzyme required for sulfatase activity